MRSCEAVSGLLNPDPVPGSPAGDRRILQLQDVDVAVDRLRSRLAAIESGEEVRTARGVRDTAERVVGELRLQVDELNREQGRIESDIDSMDRKIEAERRRLFDGSVANARELQSIEAEVANLRNRKSAKEDRILELMERREELEGGLGPAEHDLADAGRRVAEIEESSGRELVEIERTLAERAAERDRLASGIDPDLLDLYESLRGQKKGVGAAALVDGVCQGCHQQLSPMYLDRLKRAQGVRRCEYCRRILIPT